MLELSYIALTAVIIGIILYVYYFGLSKLGLEKKKVHKRIVYLALGMLLWLGYVYALTVSGFLQNYSLPPRFPIFLILPLFLFTGIVLFKNRNSTIFEAIPASWAVYFQSFRILVESLFVGTVAIGLLHAEVTIEGYNYDMIYAFTAPVIGYLVFKVKKLPKQVAIAWNYLGLVVIAFIIFLFTSTTFFPSLWNSNISLAPLDMISFPYVLVPAFLMPTAVFVHVFSIIQLRKNTKTL